jgi:AcrR family transcriptional regulator
MSSPAPKWRRRKDARPAEIVAAALSVFLEKGYAATRLDDVAERARVSKGTVYLYFATKEELFEAVVRQALLPQIETIKARAAAAEAMGTPELMGLVVGHFRQLLESDVSGIPKLVIAEAANFPDLARFYADVAVSQGLDFLASVIARGVERGEFRPVDPQVAARLFIAPLVFMALWKHSLGRHVELGMDPAVLLPAHLENTLRALAREAES